MSQAIRVQSIVHRNGSAIGGARNRLINFSKYLPITNPSAAVSRPTRPPITGLDRHRLDAANENLEELIAAGKGLRQQWADAEHWRQLARERGY
jgi:hypothetical protein